MENIISKVKKNKFDVIIFTAFAAITFILGVSLFANLKNDLWYIVCYVFFICATIVHMLIIKITNTRYSDSQKILLIKNQIIIGLLLCLFTRYMNYSKKAVLICSLFLVCINFIFLLKNVKLNKILEIYNRIIISAIIVLICEKFFIYKFYGQDFTYRTERLFWILFLCILVWITISVVWNILAYFKKIENIFLIVAFFLGIFYIIIFPPMSAPDEECHFAMAYSYSNVLLGGERSKEAVGLRENGNGCMFYEIPSRRADAEAIKNTFDFEYVWQYPGYDIYEKVKDQIGIFAGAQEQFDDFFVGRFTNGTIVAYLPAVIGITLARLVGLGGMQLIFLGRLFNFLFYIGTIYLGIKVSPIGKKILMVCALLPMSLELGASYSYDAILISSVFFFIGYFLYLLIKKEQIEIRDILILIGALLFISSTKVVYSAVIVLLLFLPIKKFKHKFIKLSSLFLCLILIIVMAIVGSFNSIAGYVDTGTSETAYYTLSYILTHIKEVIFLLVNTLIDQSEYYLGTTIGYLLGWLEFRISFVIILFICLICFLATLETRNVPRINLKTALIFIFVFLCVGGMILATTVMWTPIGNRVVEGFQGRYVLEVLPLLLIGCAYFNKSIYIQKDNYRLVSAAMVAMNLLCIITVFDIIMMR